ncbi:MAG: hypothetical protein A2X81_12270 [Desulfobacterales bacterium GWB2_56_26]|nr:MAG: hypothetical protein A2X81_12270 [Desulfobacterales bacterium GWB2_56_26]
MDKETYSQAVSQLVKLAQGDTGGSRVAAQVLLSAYNGEAWQLNVVDLCALDKPNYQAALDVIRGRVELYIEPHTLIANGGRIFEELWHRWERYHVENRAKPLCSACSGSGRMWIDDSTEIECKSCGGKGY